MVKKIVVFILVVCLAALLAGCSRKSATDKKRNYIEPVAAGTADSQNGQLAGEGAALEYDFAAAVRYEYINIKMSKYYEGEPLGDQELEMDFSGTECAKSGTLRFVPDFGAGVVHVTITTKDRECSEVFNIPDDAVPAAGLAPGESLSEKTLQDYTGDN